MTRRKFARRAPAYALAQVDTMKTARSLVTLALLLTASPAAAQTPTDLYEPVLHRIRERHLGAPLNLNNTTVRLDCLRGGCKEPWAGTLSREWLEAARSRGLIENYCVSYGYCTRTAVKRISGSVGVMFTTERPCGEGCAEVIANEVVQVTERSAAQFHMLYRLTRTSEGWAITSVTEVAHGYLDS